MRSIFLLFVSILLAFVLANCGYVPEPNPSVEGSREPTASSLKTSTTVPTASSLKTSTTVPTASSPKTSTTAPTATPTIPTATPTVAGPPPSIAVTLTSAPIPTGTEVAAISLQPLPVTMVVATSTPTIEVEEAEAEAESASGNPDHEIVVVGPQPPLATQAPRATGAPPTAVPPTKVPPTPRPTEVILSNSASEEDGINSLIETATDPFSTFALDVDTGSYTRMRDFVMGHNQLPPESEVRVEEFVNYFQQDYAPPPPDQHLGIYIDGAPSPFYRNDDLILRIGIQAAKIIFEDLPPVSLTFAIDVSGSMEQENRLGLVKESLKALVNELRPEDSIAIVVYGTEARSVLKPTNVKGDSRSEILEAIYSLRPEGETNLEEGLRLAYQEANNAYQQGGINRVILCSDGVANTGIIDPEAILAQNRPYIDKGITLTSIGVGFDDFNDPMLEKLADSGDGVYVYIDTIKEAVSVFNLNEMSKSLQTIAFDSKIEVEFNPDVASHYRLIGYENRNLPYEAFYEDVDAGEVNAGHNVTALYQVRLVPNTTDNRLLTIKLRWNVLDRPEQYQLKGGFDVSDLALATSFRGASPRYQLAVVAAQYAEVLRGSPWAEDVTLSELVEHAEWISAQLSDPNVTEFAQIVRKASKIR